MDKTAPDGEPQKRADRQAWERFDALAARLAEAYASVPEPEGMAEINRIAAEVRAEMKAERRKNSD